MNSPFADARWARPNDAAPMLAQPLPRLDQSPSLGTRNDITTSLRSSPLPPLPPCPRKAKHGSLDPAAFSKFITCPLLGMRTCGAAGNAATSRLGRQQSVSPGRIYTGPAPGRTRRSTCARPRRGLRCSGSHADHFAICSPSIGQIALTQRPPCASGRRARAALTAGGCRRAVRGAPERTRAWTASMAAASHALLHQAPRTHSAGVAAAASASKNTAVVRGAIFSCVPAAIARFDTSSLPWCLGTVKTNGLASLVFTATV